jgi:hypothetical protein
MRAALLLLLAAFAAAQELNHGVLRGQVLDYAEQSLAGGEVTLSSREEEFSAPIDRGGRFELAARPGVYSVKVEHAGYLPYQRAQVVIRAGGITNINVRLIAAEPDPGLHYFSFGVPGPIGLGAVLRRVDQIRPQRSEFGQDYMMLSYDTLAIYAPSIECDRRNFKCITEGPVVLEISNDDGITILRASKVEPDLMNRRLQIIQGETQTERWF